MNPNGLKLDIAGSVYPPSEDSFLLSKYAPMLKGRILDMCTGSGVCALANAKANPENEVIGADISLEAVECATRNAHANKIKNARFLQSDLFQKTEGRFDGMLCNPPYLPEPGLDGTGWNEAEIALSGGKTGREFTDRFLGEFGKYLEKDGKLLLLQSSINDVELTMKKAQGQGFDAKIIGKESFFFERLFVILLSSTF